MSGFYYLATPYSRHPGGVDQAHDEAVAAAIVCIKAGITVFCPIAHSHLMAKRGDLGGDFAAWRDLDEGIIAASRGIIVVMMEGWRESAGINAEIAFARALGLPVSYMTPGVAPDLGGAGA